MLCDFVHDKAKRLFSKYENAIKDKKDERNQGNQKQLEAELRATKDAVNIVKTFILP